MMMATMMSMIVMMMVTIMIMVIMMMCLVIRGLQYLVQGSHMEGHLMEASVCLYYQQDVCNRQ